MAQNFTKDEALKIALRHLVAEAKKKYESQLRSIHDVVPDGLSLYMVKSVREHCWCINVPLIDNPLTSIIDAPSRYICISKETGEVIFDGWAGE